ncbi:MAG: threonine/serine dehydratase [Clostridium sp.]
MFGMDDILEARERIAPYVYITPMLHLENLDERLGCQVYVKAECMQRTNSFKIRGVLNKMLTMSKEELARGVVTASSGNHGKSVAFAAQLLGAKATIVIPDDTPQVKVDSIRRLGAEVVVCKFAERNIIAGQMGQKHGYVLIHPYDDYQIMAGQGTVGLEVMEQLPDVDYVVVPVSGGGLIAGLSTAVRAKSEHTKVIGAEPAALCRYAESVKECQRVYMDEQQSIADELLTQQPGMRNLPLVTAYVSDFVGVSDEFIRKAMNLLLREGKILAEPSSCIGIGAVLQGEIKVQKTDKVCFVLSGGNVTQPLL